MKYRLRIYYSTEQRAEIWDRWQRGGSMRSIGRVFDWQSSSVFSVISPTGALAAEGRDIQVTERMSTVSNYPLNCITFRAGVRLPKGKLATLKAPRMVSKHPAKQAQARQVMGCGAKAYHLTKPSEAMTERFPQRAQPDSSASS